jgi:hypothetical protein
MPSQTPSLIPGLPKDILIRSSWFKEDGVRENKLKQFFVGILQDLAGQGFRMSKDESGVRISQAIQMKNNKI